MMHFTFTGLAVLALFLVGFASPSDPPKPGEKAPNFSLATLDGRVVELNALTREGPVVLVVLRGFPGYQCPICNRQVKAYSSKSDDFASLGTRVVFVYPGPSSSLRERGEEFVSDKDLPSSFIFLLDPDYLFTGLYNLRWDEPKETAYPSTFIIDSTGIVRFAVVSTTHGGRVSPEEALKEVKRVLSPEP